MGSFETKAQALQQWNRTNLELLSVSTRLGAHKLTRKAHKKPTAAYFADNAPRVGIFSCHRNNFKPHDFKVLNKAKGSLSRHQILPKKKSAE